MKIVCIKLIFYWVFLLRVVEGFGQKQADYPSELTEAQATEVAEGIIRRVNTYPIDEQQLAYDSLELLVNYFKIDSLRITTYLKRGRFELFANDNVDKALQYFINAKEIAIERNNTEREIDALVQTAQLYPLAMR